MKQITLGTTGITVPQNAFGALPIQRVSADEAVRLLRRAREGGMRFFDTARAYTDSEEKLGLAFGGHWDGLYVATKTAAKAPEALRADLETSLRLLQRDYIDIYQFHMAGQCYRPGDGTGMYEAMLEAKAQGKIRHIGITAHKIGVAEDIIASGLYETLQYPFSYLSTPREAALAESCRKANMGLIAMKALAGGLVTNADAAFAYIAQYDNVLPIWGIQRPEELEQWLGFFRTPASLTPELRSFIEKERGELTGEFCRGCGYCLPCPAGIPINNAARMPQLLRRSPYAGYLTDEWAEQMERINNCINCRACAKRCPYELDTPKLLRAALADYRQFRAEHLQK